MTQATHLHHGLVYELMLFSAYILHFLEAVAENDQAAN